VTAGRGKEIKEEHVRGKVASEGEEVGVRWSWGDKDKEEVPLRSGLNARGWRVKGRSVGRSEMKLCEVVHEDEEGARPWLVVAARRVVLDPRRQRVRG